MPEPAFSGLRITRITLDFVEDENGNGGIVQFLVDGQRETVAKDDGSPGEPLVYHDGFTATDLTMKFCQITGKTVEEAWQATQDVYHTAKELQRDALIERATNEPTPPVG